MRQSPQQENYQKVVRLTFLTVFVFFGHVASAQSDLQVQGTILDSTGEPLPSVNVVIKETTNGTVSDLNGKYSLNVPSDANFIFSFTEFKILTEKPD